MFFTFRKNDVFLKFFDILKAPWIKKFPLLQSQNKLQQVLLFKPNNSLLLFLILSRFQFYKYIQTDVNLLSHSVLSIQKANYNSVTKNILNFKRKPKKKVKKIK
jgi:hypothetical protein